MLQCMEFQRVKHDLVIKQQQFFLRIFVFLLSSVIVAFSFLFVCVMFLVLISRSFLAL